MDVLFIVSTPTCGRVVRGLTDAASRAKVSWAIFFTNDGVKILQDEKFIQSLQFASMAVVCQESWQRYMGEKVCPVEGGSQTNHSSMVASARHIISL